MHTGSCLCGAVRFEVTGELHPPDACHCTMCRKVSGHFWASTDVPDGRFSIEGAERLTWYQSSLFWDPIGQPRIAIAMGAFDQPSATRLASHIFVADKGDYYELADGVPQHAS
jgi:hypothetical protein